MFDLIGFWTALTVFLTPVTLVTLTLITCGIHLYMHQVTNGEFNPEKMYNLNPATRYWNYLLSLYDGPEILHGCIFFAGAVIGFIQFIMTCVEVVQGTAVQTYASVAQALAPFFGWVGIVLCTYFTAVYAGKFVYKLGTKVNQLREAFDTHVKDKDAHK